MAAKAPAPFQPHRVEPELGLVAVAFDVNVSRLIPISSVEEKSVRSSLQNRRHLF